MRVDLECNIEMIKDAIALGSINVVCDIFIKCRDILNHGGKVCIYDEYQAPVNYRQNLLFTNVEDFDNWVQSNFSNINCD